MSGRIIPAYLQQKGLNIDEFTSVFKAAISSKGPIMTETARFDGKKPDGLEVSDDTWATLTTRVDPLARAILDPHNLYLGATLLVTMISLVFFAVKPAPQNLSNIDDFTDDDFNDKYNNVDDYWKYADVESNAYSYVSRELARQTILWIVLFAFTISAALGTVAVIAYMIESRNSRVDIFIYEICDEVAERFELEGYEIEYRSRIIDEGMAGHFMPERAILFMELDDDEIGRRTQHSGYAPPGLGSTSDDSGPGRKESSFGTINVMVPDGYMPGQVVNVMTPSGLPIMVAVPSGLQPGESFPVQIPAQMYRPRK